MDYDDLITEIGQVGRYQLMVYAVPCFLSMLTGFQILMPVYLLKSINFRCQLPEISPWIHNDTYHYQSIHHQNSIKQLLAANNSIKSQCSYKTVLNGSLISHKCKSWVYDTSEMEANFVTEMNLVCDAKSQTTMISTCTFAGTFLGVFTSGLLSDLIGRRKCLILYLVVFLCFAFGSAFANSIAVMALCRFFIGFGCIGSFTTSFVLGVELVGPGYRYHTGIIVEYFWTFGVMILAGIAYGIRHWKYIQIAVTVPALLLLVFVPFHQIIPESPRWLYSQNRKQEADEIMKRLIRWNKLTHIDESILEKVKVATRTNKASASSVLRDIFLKRSLIFRYVIICANWFVIAMVYYGISMGSGNLPGSIYLTSFLTGAVEIPGWALAHITINKFGRKNTHIACMTLSGLFIIGLLLTNQYAKHIKWLIIMLSMFGKLFNSAAFGIIYVWTGELYPTTVRNTGLSFSSSFARLGTLLAPVLADIKTFVPGDAGLVIAYVLFASLSLLAAALCWFVPETKGKKLYETIQLMIQYERGLTDAQNGLIESPPVVNAATNVTVEDATIACTLKTFDDNDECSTTRL